MSFELNTIILEKMGWYKEIPATLWHLKLQETVGLESPNEKWSIIKYFLCNQRQMIWCIKENVIDPKLNGRKLYNFLVVDFSKKKPVYKTQELNSNLQLLKLVKENLACNKSYQRYFQINSIIK
jgi:hypothetical protein